MRGVAVKFERFTQTQKAVKQIDKQHWPYVVKNDRTLFFQTEVPEAVRHALRNMLYSAGLFPNFETINT